jgi:hypothetical protein
MVGLVETMMTADSLQLTVCDPDEGHGTDQRSTIDKEGL